MNDQHDPLLSFLVDKALTLQTTSIGRHFDIKDEEGCEEFAEWFLETAESLGITISPVDQENGNEKDIASPDHTRDE